MFDIDDDKVFFSLCTAVLAVLGICCTYLPVLNWLAGVRDTDDIPPQLFVAWYGETWGQIVIGGLIVLLGYLGLWKARRGAFSG